MSLNKLIIDTLSHIGIPVTFQVYEGEEDTFITFFEYNQLPALNADDEEQNSKHFIQVDIWSNQDYTNIVNQVKNSLLQNGFKRTSEAELYETETGTFHKAIRFSFVQ
jgi:hypothetical protein